MMEEIAVAKPLGCRCRCGCLPSCGCADGCSDKSRAARRRRMEIRRFKLVAANAAAESSGSNNKRLKFSATSTVAATACCCRIKDEVEEKHSEVTEKVTGSVSSSPPLVLASTDGERCPQNSVVSICGGRREMEDAVRVVPSFVPVAGGDNFYHYFGVFDGHGGSQAALHCKERLHEALAEEIRLTDPVEETQWEAVMKACFLKMDVEVVGLCGSAKQLKHQGIKSQREEKIVDRVEAKAPETVGSTAVVAVVSGRQIVVANCGDSRAVLSRGGKAIPLSTDHKPEVAEEMARIEAAGGRVIYWNGYRVLGVLAMSRAIGDKYLKPFVIAEPELSFTERSEEDECLILASDGLWDVVSNEVACEISRKCLAAFHGGSSRTAKVEGPCPGAEAVFESPAGTAAALLTKLALARGSTDNISVIVVDLKSKQPSSNV